MGTAHSKESDRQRYVMPSSPPSQSAASNGSAAVSASPFSRRRHPTRRFPSGSPPSAVWRGALAPVADGEGTSSSAARRWW
jgi:hypothetical protein